MSEIAVNTSPNKIVKRTVYTVATLVALNVASIVNLYGFPSEAFYGLTSTSLYILAIIFYLIPISLVSAEFGSMYASEYGGIYVWITNAFNFKVGIVATWLQWIQSVFFYPLSLTFAAVSFSYLIPDTEISLNIANNKLYIISFILVVFWVCTIMGTKGLHHIGKISSFGMWLGIFSPVVILVGFAIYYLVGKGTIEMDMHTSDLIPHFKNIDSVVMAISIMLFYSGIEMNSVHVNLMKNPTKDYPRAVLLSCLCIAAIYILGTLAIAIVIPKENLNLTQSFIVAIQKYSIFSGLKFVLPIVAVAIALGVFANTITWLAGPSTSIKYIADQGYLPPIVKKTNKNGAPISILYTQAILITIIVFIYVFLPQIQEGYQMILQVTNSIYLTMYALMFIAFIRLRYTKKHINRPFMAGKNIFWAWIVFLIGFCSVIGSLILSFFPPQQLHIATKGKYVWFLIIIYTVLVIPPILYTIFHKKRYPVGES